MKLLFALSLMFLPSVVSSNDSLWDDVSPVSNKQTPILVELPITLHENVIVNDEYITLGDLFSGLTEEQEDKNVSKSPALGKEAILDANWLQSIARSHNINWRAKNDLVHSVVKRASFEVTKADLLLAFKQKLIEQGLPEQTDLSLNPIRANVLLPKGTEFEILLQDVSFSNSNYTVTGVAKILVSGKETHRITLSGKAIPMVEVVVLTKSLSTGELITPEGLTLKNVREDQLRKEKRVLIEDLIGKEVKRPLKTGQMIGLDDVRTKVMVAKGKPVTLSFVKKGIMLSAQGKAIENGGLGDIVRVMNLQSKTVIQGTVTGPEAVTVTTKETFRPIEGEKR